MFIAWEGEVRYLKDSGVLCDLFPCWQKGVLTSLLVAH